MPAMGNTKPKLALSQETLRILVQEKPAKVLSNSVSTFPWCPTFPTGNVGQR